MPAKHKEDQSSPVFGYLKQPSMIDFPDRLSGVMFVSGCNFACGFCHNPALIGPPRPGLSWDQLTWACQDFRKQWVEGMVISGGEPTLIGDRLSSLIKFFRQFGFAIKLDTNGSFPDTLAQVLPWLDYVAMDIKCDLEQYPELTGFNRIGDIVRAIEIVKKARVDYEFRTTIIETWHNQTTMQAIAEAIRPARRYVIQPFIPRPDLPDPEMRKLPRTRPEYMEKIKSWLEATECAGKIEIA